MALASNEKVVRRPIVQNNTPKHPLHSNVCEKMYVKVRNLVQRSTSSNIFWNEKQGEKVLSFVGMVQVSTDKTATTLKENAVAAYSVHAVF